MISFTIEKSASYGARIFIQQATDADQINSAMGLHELAKELSIWKGADKSVTFPPQEVGHFTIGATTKLSGYEMEAEEMAVMEKRCKSRRLIDVTMILTDMKQDWA